MITSKIQPSYIHNLKLKQPNFNLSRSSWLASKIRNHSTSSSPNKINLLKNTLFLSNILRDSGSCDLSSANPHLKQLRSYSSISKDISNNIEPGRNLKSRLLKRDVLKNSELLNQNKNKKNLQKKSQVTNNFIKKPKILPANFIEGLVVSCKNDPILDKYNNSSEKQSDDSSINPNSNSNNSNEPQDNPSTIISEYPPEIQQDITTNIFAAIARSKHILIYQEDEWGEDAAIRLLHQPASISNSNIITIDIPDWSVIGSNISQIFEELTIVSHSYTFPSVSALKTDTTESSILENDSEYKNTEAQQHEEDEYENDEDNDSDSDSDNNSKSFSNDSEDTLWFESESENNSKPPKKKGIEQCSPLPQLYMENPLSSSETKLLDSRLSEIVSFSKDPLIENIQHQPLIIVVKNLGDLLNTRIGYTLFNRLVKAAHDFNNSLTNSSKQTSPDLTNTNENSEITRGPTIIIGLLHPSIFYPEVAPKTIPPFDSNPAAPSSTPDLFFSSSGDPFSSYSLGTQDLNNSKFIKPSSIGSQSYPIIVSISSSKTSSENNGYKIFSQNSQTSTSDRSYSSAISSIGSSLFTRIALPLSNISYMGLKTTIRALWAKNYISSQPKVHDTINKFELYASNRQKSVFDQVLRRNSLILRNIFILNNISNVTFSKTYFEQLDNTEPEEIPLLGKSICYEKIKTLLSLIPGDIPGRFFLSETFMHRIVVNAIGLRMMDVYSNFRNGLKKPSSSESFDLNNGSLESNSGLELSSITLSDDNFIQAWKQVVSSYKSIGDSAFSSPTNRAFSLGNYNPSKSFHFGPNPKFVESPDPNITTDLDNIYCANLIPEIARPFIDGPSDSIGRTVKDKKSVGIDPKLAEKSTSTSSEKSSTSDTNDSNLNSEGLENMNKNQNLTSLDKAHPKSKNDLDSPNDGLKIDEIDPVAEESIETTSNSRIFKNKFTENKDINADRLLNAEIAKRLKSLKNSKINSYEQRLLSCVVNPNSIPSGFSNVCAKPETIITLQELISLPLLLPELFGSGVLGKHAISGLLLFGPPGTGKTMLAKAVAKESGSTVLNIKSSDVYDKYVGEGEKLVKAIFSLAHKLSPCVVFIDEVDALFAARSGDQSTGYKREIINQFMSEWDGLTSSNKNSNKSRVMVLAATNRPFDLDDAILRRLPRRILVDLPDETERKQIIELHLEGEFVSDDIDIEAIAKKAVHYSGSDLKNLCIAAALSAVRENITGYLNKLNSENISSVHDNANSSDKDVMTELKRTGDLDTQTTNSDFIHEKNSEEKSKSQTKLNAELLTEYIRLKRKQRSIISSGKKNESPSNQESDFKSKSSNQLVLHNKHFDAAFKMVSSSSSDDMNSIIELRKWNQKFGDNAKERKDKVSLGFIDQTSSKI
ncbi:Protein MSP1 [Smittium culicis]|uniref:Protein MSP1 n=1 Tax=Smittium culicis TaxID=133412 RepID=A0A1R1YNQ5_9FUNG|nr:Protein MSP1 [Smittium culicis]